MLIQSIVLPPILGYPFHITAKRYWLPSFEQNISDPAALTLIFLHSTSFHKEAWEPSLEHLFNFASRHYSPNPLKIREAWTLDCPNHGEAARLNEEQFQNPKYRHNFTCEKYARAVHHFLSAGPEHGAKIDFRRRNLVGIGHSLGGVAMTILQCIEPILPFSCIILVEPMLSPQGRHHLNSLRERLVKAVKTRRHIWDSREQAREWFHTKYRRKHHSWEPRVIDLYVKHGLNPLANVKDKEKAGHNEASCPVTLACSREEEVAMYQDDTEGPTKPIGDLNRACARMPVHIVFGAINDFIPACVQDATVDPISSRRFASITKIDGVGHLIPQIKPEKLANVIFNALESTCSPIIRAKL